jgi:NitT/TauT family transport system ATP-binding protein
VIELRGATKRFRSSSGGIHTAVRDLNMTVRAGEFVAVVGPTGCGKSTTLSLISGLEPASAGEVVVNGRPVDGIPDGIGYMFQTDAVLPWRTVLDNVAAGPRYRGAGKKEARERAREWVRRVGLAGFEEYYPHQLSGGMRKRVALAQTLVGEPSILLMDEPFSALDVQTRGLMQDELLRLWTGDSRDPSGGSPHSGLADSGGGADGDPSGGGTGGAHGNGAAVVFVTHDLEEAVVLADRVVVMTAGPATVKGSFPVPLDRPRDAEEIRLTPEFLDVYREVWESLREEVQITRERSAGHAA